MLSNNELTEPWFIRTKLIPPRANARLIERVDAASLLNNVNEYTSGFIIAPAGFGKSSLLSQWQESQIKCGAKVAWLSLDANDSDLRHFASYLIIALTKAGVPLGPLEFAAYKCFVEFSVEQVSTLLIAKLSCINEKVVLILDDYYRAESKEVNALISQLLDHLPYNFCIIISSRSQPNLNVASRILGNSAFEINQSMLSFSFNELKRFIGPGSSEQYAQTLLEQTEGWAVAVQLATVANKGITDIGTLFKGKQQYITDYFTEQILDQSTSQERQFLMYTSILEQFNFELASAVTGLGNVQGLIDNSPHIRSLLITLDSQQVWFRYHHLFCEILYNKLKYQQPELINSLHHKASRWFESNQQISNAVIHARLSGDIDRAAQLFLNAGGWELVLYGGVGLMRNLLRNFKSPDFARHPRVRLAYVYSLLKDGYIDEAEAQFNKIKLTTQHATNKLLTRDIYLIERLLSSYRDELINITALQEMKKNLARWNKDDLLGIAIIESVVVLSSMALGMFNDAKMAAVRGLSAMRQAESILGANYLILHLGQIALHRAKFELAKQHLTESIEMADKNFGIDSRLKTNSEINLFALKFWQTPHSFKCKAMQEQIQTACTTDGWSEIYAAGFSSQFEYSRLFNMSEESSNLLSLSIETARKRQLPRLKELSNIYRLTYALTQNKPNEILLAMKELQTATSTNATLYENWFLLCEKSFALGLALLKGYSSKNTIKDIDEAIERTQRIGATLYLIRLLVLRATLHISRNEKSQCFDDLISAAGYATHSDVKTPFFLSRTTIDSIEEGVEYFKNSKTHRLELAFLNQCVKQYHRLFLRGEDNSIEQALSKRETEVLSKLALGLANKEIARALYMTNHTVKFHLKNIFKKLDVDKRINAVNKARAIGLIE
jgi:LuxR family maltose regulon positive regulatory protein